MLGQIPLDKIDARWTVPSSAHNLGDDKKRGSLITDKTNTAKIRKEDTYKFFVFFKIDIK